MASINMPCSYSTNFSELVNGVEFLDLRNTVIFVLRGSIFNNSLSLHQSYSRKCFFFFNVDGTRSDLCITFCVGIRRY